MALRAIKRNFTGGEVAQTIASRDDLTKYNTSCREMRNFIAQLHGGARYRSGFKFTAEALGAGVMIPFEFNTEEEDMYVLVFTDEKLRIVQDDGHVLSGGNPVEIVSPYTEEHLLAYPLNFAQIGDVMYLAHPKYAARKLVRTSSTSWALSSVTFASSVVAPASPSVAWSGQAGGTFSQAYKVTSVTSDGEESVPTPAFSDSDCYPPAEWIDGDHIDVHWSTAAGAAEYNIYKEKGGYYGIVGVSESTSFRDDNFDPDIDQAPPESNNPFTGGNHPSAAAFHQQRLWFAGSEDNPQTFNGSQVGAYENFNKSRPTNDDDSVEFVLSSGQINQIKWLASFGDLIIGTAGAEFRVSGGDGDAITPASVDARPQSFWGSKSLRPIVIGNSVVHVQRQGSTVRDLFYSLERDGYAGNNLSVLADHLFDGHSIVSWAYQQEPDSVIWCVRDDGILLGMSYLKEHEIWGWHWHETDGEFETVCTVGGDEEDRLYAIVKRVIDGSTVRYIEKLETKWREEDGIEYAFYLDSALTYDGWNTNTMRTFTLTGGSTWENGESLTMTAVDFGPFSVGSVGDYYLLRSGDDEAEVLVTAYTSSTVVTVRAINDVPESLQGDSTNDWVKLVTVISGLDHLEGKSVSALADGSPYTDFTVDSGEITLTRRAAIITVGLPYTGVLAPLPFEVETEQGTSQGRERSFGQIYLRLFQTVGGKVGVGGVTDEYDDITLDYIPYEAGTFGQPIPPFTGVKEISSPGGADPENSVYVVQDSPLPFNIMSMIVEIDFGG